MSEVIKQRQWTDSELRAAGFKRYDRKKDVVLARKLPASEAPKRIYTPDGDTLTAYENYMLLYYPGNDTKASIDEYEQWPVEPEIFNKTYKPWNESWNPTPAQRHLLRQGAKPYYKAVGVWAKPVKQDTYIQSLEHDSPVLVPKGRMMAIGVNGEPYSMGEDAFTARYEDSNSRMGILQRLVNFFKG